MSAANAVIPVKAARETMAASFFPYCRRPIENGVRISGGPYQTLSLLDFSSASCQELSDERCVVPAYGFDRRLRPIARAAADARGSDRFRRRYIQSAALFRQYESVQRWCEYRHRR